MTLFAGIDLAWTAHRASGICLLEGGAEGVEVRRLDAAVVEPDTLAKELAAAPDLVAAIDAPLLIGPGRTAERELGRRFGAYRASAHSASEALLRDTGRMAGPLLAAALAARGVVLDPTAIAPRIPGRFAFECYPHAQHVVLFRLAQRIPYKRKKGRDTAFLRLQLGVLQGQLRAALVQEIPSAASDAVVAAALAPEALVARGTALKTLEDRLDALTCALAAYLAWRDGLTAADVLAGPATGYVAVPGLRFDPRFTPTSVLAPTSP